jgi:hypothetical protein
VLRLTRPTRRTAALTGAAMLGVTGALVLGIGLTAGHGAAAQPAVVATAAPTTSAVPTTSAPQPAATTSASPSATPTPLRTPSSDKHVRITSVGIDLPLLPLTPKHGVIDPPTLTAAYWIESYGDPVASADQADNTLYIAAHSDGSGVNGFDPLLSKDHRSGAVKAGDVIEVTTPKGTVRYTVERTQRYGKNALAAADDVWKAHPGRLVLITCFQHTDGRATTENFVVFAQS